MASTVLESGGNCSNSEVARPVANFSPSLWGDQFLGYISDYQAKEEYYQAIEVAKNELRSMLNAPSGCKIEDTMNLIDTIERLGVSYHFVNEIEEKLEQFFDVDTDYEDEDYDLYTVALHFRLFRQHGYRISSDIFRRFMDDNGKFQGALEYDARGLLSLYEAAHLRTHGEDILEEALSFATRSLKFMAPNLASPLKEQVMHALVQPLHLGGQRIEARNYISVYEKCEQNNKTLLRFAKLDYNSLQMLHKEELGEISRWWKELDLPSKLPYARNRLVECFFWAVLVYHEPQYSRARVILAKAIAMTSIIDDTYDAYGITEELNVITEAIERWDISQIDQLPNYFKPFYKALLELYEQFEQELAEKGRSYGIHYAKEKLKELVRSYRVEANWFIQGYMPPFAQYLDNALITCTYHYHTAIALLGTKSATREAFEWLSKNPKMLVAGLTICRVIDDMATYEVEKERGQSATGIECYMKENGVTKEEAMNKFSEMATNAWKDINEECLGPSEIPRDVLARILNLARVIKVTYKNNQDGYTEPEKVIKPHMIVLLVDSIEI